jgi:Skp family chaperone for outer membrane proteins
MKVPWRSVVVAPVAILAAIWVLASIPRVAYIETSRVMTGFSDAAAAEKEIHAEEVKAEAQSKVLQDSLQAVIDLMSREYNSAAPARKKELQDLLSAHNQQVSNFRYGSAQRIDELRKVKLKPVHEKINAYIAEYGRKHRCSIIFGTTAEGSILYGDSRRYDITDNVIAGLNERYR